MAKRSISHDHQPQEVRVNRLESVINPENYQADFKKPDEFMGRPIIIMGYEVLPGRMGDFAHIEAIDIVSEESVIISTGGKLIMAALEDIQNAGGFPVVTTFGKSGSAFVFKSVNISKSVDLVGLVNAYLGNNEPNEPPYTPLSE